MTVLHSCVIARRDGRDSHRDDRAACILVRKEKITVLHSTRSRALADSWFPVTQVNVPPLSEAGADVVQYQLTVVVLHVGRSSSLSEGDLRTVSTVRTNRLSVATCCTIGWSERNEAPSHAPSATATQATPDARPRRSVTVGSVADVVLSLLLATRCHELSCCNDATYTSLTGTVCNQNSIRHR